MKVTKLTDELGRAVGEHMRGKPAAKESGQIGGDAGLSLPAALRVLLDELSPSRRRLLVPLLLLMLAGALAEVATLGALLPFLAVIADSEGSPLVARVAPLLDVLDATEPGRAIYVLTGLFALAALVSAGLRLTLLRASHGFVNGMACELAVGLYERALHEPYIHHTRRNSSEMIAAINKVELLTWSVLTPLMYSAVALVIAVFIVIGLVAIDPAVALAAGAGFGSIYVLTTRVTRSRLRRNSRLIAEAESQRVKSMQEGLGGIRDVLIDQSQPMFLETYERAMVRLRDARTRNAFFAGAPRFVVEALAMVLIAAMAVAIIGRPGGLVQAIPVLGALALGAQRLLPLVQQVYNGWSAIMGNRQVLLDVVALLCRPAPARAPATLPSLSFERAIRLEHVAFSYSERMAPTLRDVNLEIPKGARVGIVGQTGSGKSTLMDLVLGLLEPQAGQILIDGVLLSATNRAAWQKRIAHVPQAIFLADASVAENIAFGVRANDIDRERLRRAVELAELVEVIAALPRGYGTRVGERGIQLSGGQRQRIGIARALYKQASVLVFDEATSALDTGTEGAVMSAIRRLDRSITVFIVAHRLSTLEGCDTIVELEGGTVKVVKRRELLPTEDRVAKESFQ